MWITNIAVKNKEVKEKLEKICANIAEKDNTFTYKVTIGYGKLKGQWLFKIFSVDKNIAHKRGIWIISKITEEKLLYWVKQEKGKIGS